MKNYLNLNEMLEQENLFRRVNFRNPIFVVDSNALKYKYEETDARVVITSGVVNEVLWKPEIFPTQSLYELGKILNPEIVNHFVSEEDEKIIFGASLKSPKAEYRRHKSIGWVDTQQIAFALNAARNGERVALVSNDRDISGTVDKIVEVKPEFNGKLVALSLRKYLGRIYGERFACFDREIKRFLLMQIEKDYRIAC